jgi:hypothetical protein
VDAVSDFKEHYPKNSTKEILRVRFFKSIDDLQQSLNEYLFYYNFQRVHVGVTKTGAIPIDGL